MGYTEIIKFETESRCRQEKLFLASSDEVTPDPHKNLRASTKNTYPLPVHKRPLNLIPKNVKGAPRRKKVQNLRDSNGSRQNAIDALITDAKNGINVRYYHLIITYSIYNKPLGVQL